MYGPALKRDLLNILLLQETQEFLDGADKGAILYSMGHIFDTRFLPEGYLVSLFEVFAR